MFSIPGMVTSPLHFCTIGNIKLKRIFYKRLLLSKKLQQIMQWKAACILSNAYSLNNLIFPGQEIKASAAFLEKEKSWLCYQNCHTDSNGFYLLLHPQSWAYLPVSVRVLLPFDCSGGSCTQQGAKEGGLEKCFFMDLFLLIGKPLLHRDLRITLVWSQCKHK